MRNKNGFIKLHRRIVDWRWFKHPNTVVVWLTLLSLAEWQTGCDLLPGQIVITQKEISEITGLSRQQIRTAISHLEATKELTKVPTTVATTPAMLITIENWRFYQHKQEDTNHGSNHESTKGSTNLPLYKKNKEKEEKEEGQPAPVEAVPMPDEFKQQLASMFSWRKDN